MIDAAKVYRIGYEVVADALAAERAAHAKTRQALSYAQIAEKNALDAGSELLTGSLDKNRRLDSCNAQIKSLRKALKTARCDRDGAEVLVSQLSTSLAEQCESRRQWTEYATYLRNALHRAWNVPGAENR